MPTPAKPIPMDIVKARLEHDSEHGVLRWKLNRGGRAKAGHIAGCRSDSGYWVIKVDGKRYKRSRLTWAICKGEDPPRDIEVSHKNCMPMDDRIGNLWLLKHGQNLSNRPARKASGLPKGVRQVSVNGRNMWKVRISKGSKTRDAGPYGTLAKAISKAHEIGRAMHGEFWNGESVSPSRADAAQA